MLTLVYLSPTHRFVQDKLTVLLSPCKQLQWLVWIILSRILATFLCSLKDNCCTSAAKNCGEERVKRAKPRLRGSLLSVPYRELRTCNTSRWGSISVTVLVACDRHGSANLSVRVCCISIVGFL